MRQRFTVIEGGAGPAAPAIGAHASEGAAMHAASGKAVSWDAVSWRIVLHRASGVSARDVAAWRALRVRMGEGAVQADPDYLLAVAQHQAGGRDLVFAFAWGEVSKGESAPATRLHGVVPLALPHTLWGNGRIPVWRPHKACGGAVIETGAFDAVRTALAAELRTRHPRQTLDLPESEEPHALPDRPRVRIVPSPGSIPPRSLVTVRAADTRARDAVERITDPLGLRDAVETFLLLDADTAAAPIIGDPSEAALVRVVMRRFAQRRQASVELVRRDGVLVAGALGLGTGAEAVVWRRAEGALAARIERQA